MEEFDALFAVNVRAAFFLVQQLLPILSEGSSVIFTSSLAAHAAVGNLSAYAATKGSVINIGSGVTAITPPQTAVYTATKGAVDVITGVLAREPPQDPRQYREPQPLTETEGTHSAGMIASEFEAGIIAQAPALVRELRQNTTRKRGSISSRTKS
ncbi:SDR family NAD(P)-dependent oxidoreductase [Rhizobium calliandrae]|uniref:SDR family NAD(P)-dependent oxidoreductase n=1 Tax=Rhizobium calliandrae TaxID=1312182 RepID=A0ABT7KQQ1_9HYPH|nr:SDR family NAD(P)-dependent oxidoreductase [Rhizobium calliandrae]MDL2410268.1 SDR family NAD(P)-dependent oxidoreductase [Rhizobium calliandrae]